MTTRLVIATRRSRLALWQAEHVKALLEAQGLAAVLLPMSTRGDELLQVSLTEVGGKGLFIKELETALADGRADLAVHSMKDLPAELPPGFTLAAITARDDPRDAFVSARYAGFAELPAGSIVGTSSLRRQAQVLERYPKLAVQPLRGNVDTRLAKLDRGEYAAIVLAYAGLRRLGLADRARSVLPIEESMPAPGQGALGVECLSTRTDVQALVAPLADAATSACVRAERAVNRALGGDCTIPLGAFADPQGASLRLRALVAAPDGRRAARAEALGEFSDPESIGRRVAERLQSQGADQILAALAK
jgi:hydroxymethylbilane synthase